MHHRRRTARIEHFELAAERSVIGAAAVGDIIGAGPERTRMVVAGVRPPGPMTLAQASTFQSGLIGLPSRSAVIWVATDRPRGGRREWGRGAGVRSAIGVGGHLGRDRSADAQHLLDTLAAPLHDVARRMPAANARRATSWSGAARVSRRRASADRSAVIWVATDRPTLSTCSIPLPPHSTMSRVEHWRLAFDARHRGVGRQGDRAGAERRPIGRDPDDRRPIGRRSAPARYPCRPTPRCRASNASRQCSTHRSTTARRGVDRCVEHWRAFDARHRGVGRQGYRAGAERRPIGRRSSGSRPIGRRSAPARYPCRPTPRCRASNASRQCSTPRTDRPTLSTCRYPCRPTPRCRASNASRQCSTHRSTTARRGVAR